VLHVQLICSVLPATELESTGQSLHAALPVSVLYSPAAHMVQAPPLGPVNPASHLQSSLVLLASSNFELRGQLEQSEDHTTTSHSENLFLGTEKMTIFPVIGRVHVI